MEHRVVIRISLSSCYRFLILLVTLSDHNLMRSR